MSPELVQTTWSLVGHALENVHAALDANNHGLRTVEPPVPALPKQWTAAIATKSDGPSLGDTAMVYTDSINSRSMTKETSDGLFPGYPMTIQEYQGPTINTSLISINDVCRNFGVKFADPFGWLTSSLTQYQGKETVNGVDCDKWYFSTRGLPVPVETNLTLFVDSAAPVPVRYVISSNSSGGLPGANTSTPVHYTQDLSNFTAGSPPAAVWDMPSTCGKPVPLCAEGSVKTMDMVLAQPAYAISNYSISNQDTADWLGDAIFTCADVLSNHTASDQYSVVSLFQVEWVKRTRPKHNPSPN
jgi:hypothetical protein